MAFDVRHKTFIAVLNIFHPPTRILAGMLDSSCGEDFDRWNRVKKGLENTPESLLTFPQEGEVWMCSFGKNIGREQNGSRGDFSRPGLVVKRFSSEMFWVVPLSTKQKPLDFYFNYTDPNDIPVAAVLAQLRLISIKRFDRKLYDMPYLNFRRLIACIKSLF